MTRGYGGETRGYGGWSPERWVGDLALRRDPGPIDGEDGPRTHAAVQRFQSEHQPEAGAVDGVAGARTRAALAVALAKVTPAS